MKKKLLIFGDSWPAGIELDFDQGEKPFGHLISEQLGLSLGHYPVPATGIPHLLLQINHAIKRQSVTGSNAIFCMSSISRSMYFENGSWKEIHARNNDPVSENFYRYIYSEELATLSMNTVLLALQRICQQYHINDHYISCWDSLDLSLPGIDKSKVYQEGKISMADILDCRKDQARKDITIDKSHPMIYPNECHPNQQGHVMIANELIKWIDFQ